METVAPSIYFKICHRTTYGNFKYLVKCFCNSEPIPHANKFQHTGTAAAVETPENYPTSMNTATEWHVNAKLDDDLSTTQDPHMSTEAPVEGTSAECAEMKTVVLESVPHEMQDQLQNSLQTTLRLPTEGKPSKCRQEAVDSVVTATHMNGMAEPQITDVDGMAPLGRELAERARGIDKGNEMEHKPQV